MTNPTEMDVAATRGASSQIVAMFETYEQARSARDGLIATGVDRSRTELLDRSAAHDDASFSYERNEEGLWAAIKNFFMPDAESHLYAEGIGRGYAMLVVRGTNSDYDAIISVLESYDPIDVDAHAAEWRQTGWSGTYAGQVAMQTPQPTAEFSPAPSTAATMPGREEVIPVYEEQLRVGKREVGRGSVRVRSYVIEMPVQEQVSLREEQVQVERRAVDRPVTATDVGAGAFKERTIEVTATAEEAVIAKDTRVKEEIVVRKEEQDRTQTVSDTVRRTEVEVEDDRVGVGVPTTAPTNPERRG